MESALLDSTTWLWRSLPHGDRHREHITRRPHPLAGLRFGQVVVGHPTGCSDGSAMSSKIFVRRRGDLAAGGDDLGNFGVVGHESDSTPS